MRTVTMYQADDGTLWGEESDALRRDELVATVKSIMAPLGERYESADKSYEYGSGYVQHDREIVSEIRRQLSRVLGRDLSSWPTSLASVTYRVFCIDQFGREWGQPYYASHPDKATSLHLIERREPKGPSLANPIVGYLADREPTP